MTFPLELLAFPHPNCSLAAHTSCVKAPERLAVVATSHIDSLLTGVALQDVRVRLVGEGGVAPVPVGRHVPPRHVRALGGQRGRRQDGQRPQQQVLSVLADNRSDSRENTNSLHLTSLGF